MDRIKRQRLQDAALKLLAMTRELQAAWGIWNDAGGELELELDTDAGTCIRYTRIELRLIPDELN